MARDIPTDRRLVAVAEVRDMTPLRDETGGIVTLPEVERVLVGCLDAIRRARAESSCRPARVEPRLLHIWPVVDLPLEDLVSVARRLTPLTEGLGLEQVVVSGRLAQPDGKDPIEAVMRIGYEPSEGVTVRLTDPPPNPCNRSMTTRRR